jgi:sugar phosphate isomerase/epimerase
MVDDEGFLAIPDDKERLAAVENHKKWIDAAKFLGCKTVRVNLHGSGETAAKKLLRSILFHGLANLHSQ